MCKGRRSMPRLYMEPDYNFDFAIILAAWAQERLEYCLDFVRHFGTKNRSNISSYAWEGRSNLNGQT